MSNTKAIGVLPRLWTGRRLLQCSMLVAIGVTQAMAVLVISLSATARINAQSLFLGVDTSVAMIGATITAILLAVGQMRYAEAFAASYIHALRMRYMTHVMLAPDNEPPHNIGHVLTRVVNDMSAIKLWLARGLVVFFAAVPMIGTIAVWLFFNAPAQLVPIGLALVVWALLTSASIIPLTGSIRQTRYRRGGVASVAGTAISNRESLLGGGRWAATRRRIERRSAKLTNALVHRATWSGLMRSSGQLILPVAVLIYLAMPTGSQDLPGTASITTFLMITAFVTAQMTVLSAGLEYFQGARIAFEKIEKILRTPSLDLEHGKRLTLEEWRSDVVWQSRSADSDKMSSSLTLPAGEISELNFADQFERERFVSTILGMNDVDYRSNIFIGSTCLDNIALSDIWRRVKLVSPGSAPAASILQLQKRSRLSATNTLNTLRLFGLDNMNELPADSSLRVRAAQTVLANPAIVIIDDPELAANTELLDTFVTCLQQRQTTMLFKSNLDKPTS